ncbi:MAG: tRNA lysidine(34) synthetase TilS [Amylibacter sp.]|nr:tRNA lysidine(34) synthetase TilS [Amylibacter sp.]
MSDNDPLTAQINSGLAAVPKGALGVAVSGGSDSVALLRLLCNWGHAQGRKIYAATVNHNLRAEAQDEAEFVANLCRKLDVPHQILSWDNWDGRGNLQSAARDARKVLLTDWAQKLGLKSVAIGHTQDDQAETFLLRLARGSGVDGLSGMQKISGNNPVWVRPMLGITRMDLRDYLSDLSQSWVEDPSNQDQKYDRVKMRNAMPVLAELGLTSERLANTAHGLQSARAALDEATQNAARKCCTLDAYGTVAIDLEKLQPCALDIQYRVISHAMKWVTGAKYRPRFEALKSVYALLRQGKSQTLAGCYIKTSKHEQIIVMREIANMKPIALETGCFDGRWQISADTALQNTDIRPLGEKGLQQLKNWRELGISRDILMQSPAAWQDNTVIAAPLAGFSGPVTISLKIHPDQFYFDIVSH